MTEPQDGRPVRTLEVSLGERSYPIHIGPGLLHRHDLLRPHLATGRPFIVTNETVAPLYLDALRATVGDSGTAIMPDGEQYKTLENASSILDRLIAEGCRRDSTVLALGGFLLVMIRRELKRPKLVRTSATDHATAAVSD